jgi:hypothetical protein
MNCIFKYGELDEAGQYLVVAFTNPEINTYFLDSPLMSCFKLQ